MLRTGTSHQGAGATFRVAEGILTHHIAIPEIHHRGRHKRSPTLPFQVRAGVGRRHRRRLQLPIQFRPRVEPEVLRIACPWFREIWHSDRMSVASSSRITAAYSPRRTPKPLPPTFKLSGVPVG